MNTPAASQPMSEQCLQGRLDFNTVPAIWSSLQQQIHDAPDITLDLSQVEYADSAALALLLQAQEVANQQSGKLTLRNIPQDLLELAHLSNVDKLLTGG